MLADLQHKLSSLSHNEDAVKAVRAFCEELSGTKERLRLWNSNNALVRAPIEVSQVKAAGFTSPDDEFVLLQGDIVRTDAAYILGERVTGYSKFVTLNSSCDLVAGRAKCSILLPLVEIRKDEEGVNKKLGLLAKFALNDCMYLPPLPQDPPEVVGHAINFELAHQIRTAELHLADRVASLSLLGWRIFASFSRMVFSRANQREVLFRQSLDGEPVSDAPLVMVASLIPLADTATKI